MKQKRYLVSLGALSAALAGCGAEVSAPPGPNQVTPPTGSSGSPSTPTAGSPSTPTGTGGSSTVPAGTGGAAPGGATATTGGTTPGGGATATGGAAPGGAPTTPTGPTCVQGTPATTQIPRLLNRQYDAVVRDLLGVTTLADGTLPSAGLYADYTGPMNVDAWRLYQEVGQKVATEVMGGANRSRFIACEPTAPDCLVQTIRTFGRKAFRRPLTEAEVTRFQRLAQTTPAGTAEEVAATALFSFLVSPSFLQVTELTTLAEGTAIRLSGHEVAARLSFLLWGSVPDDVLNAAADADQLQTKEQILAQAQRMIMDRAKTAPLVAAYHRKYLDMDNADSHWWKTPHDTAKYPLYSQAAEQSYMAELDKFFEEVAFGGGSFKDIFLSNVGYVNNATAGIYGLDPAAYGAELTRVDLDPAQRPGFLTRIGFLQSYSHFDATSPILRGAYITVNLIGVNPGAPDPNFFLTQPPAGTYLTERAYVEALTQQPSCAGCHIPYVNPPGFVLENYDSIGKWQTVDPRSGGDAVAGAINPTANVTFAADNVQTITTPRQMMEEIVKLPTAKKIYAQKWVSFATGRLPNDNDACTVDLINTKLATDGYTVLNLLADLTQADSFRLRVRETP